MSWLVLFFGLQAGMVSQQAEIPPSYWQTPPNTFEQTMDVRAVLLDHLEVKAFMRSLMTSDSSFPLFDPFRIDYGTEASIFYGPLRIGVRHECDHPVSHYFDGFTDSVLNGESTEFFVRFDAKVQF